MNIKAYILQIQFKSMSSIDDIIECLEKRSDFQAKCENCVESTIFSYESTGKQEKLKEIDTDRKDEIYRCTKCNNKYEAGRIIEYNKPQEITDNFQSRDPREKDLFEGK